MCGWRMYNTWRQIKDSSRVTFISIICYTWPSRISGSKDFIRYWSLCLSGLARNIPTTYTLITSVTRAGVDRVRDVHRTIIE